MYGQEKGGSGERFKTGIAGLDTMLYGGVPINNQVILAGGPGSGKTLMSFEICYNSAKAGIPSVFLALEEEPDKVIKNAKSAFPEFKDIDDLIAKKLLYIDGEGSSNKLQQESDSSKYIFGNMVADIEGILSEYNAKCLVIDSISLIKLMLGDELSYRRSMISLVSNLRRLNVTSFLTVEMPSSERKDLKFTPEFYIFDGIITMYQTGQEDKRTLAIEVVKMRGTNHSWVLSPYEIESNGFKVFTIEE
jgi:KaiC/GvpD/RAD55 family RecA-like ATPase